MFLEKGQRGLLLGKTGSGKTQDALFQLRNVPVWPAVIIDTKIEDAFFSLRDPDNPRNLDVADNFEQFERFTKLPKKDMPDYILVRPEAWEVNSPEMDKYLQLLYRKFGPVFIYIDEVFNSHVNGRPVPGLMELLGRGRSKGKTVLSGNQRPSHISRSLFTECDKFYVHRLLDKRDRETLDSVIPDFSDLKQPPKYHFYHFDTSSDDPPKLFLPVPVTEIEPEKIYTRNWI